VPEKLVEAGLGLLPVDMALGAALNALMATGAGWIRGQLNFNLWLGIVGVATAEGKVPLQVKTGVVAEDWVRFITRLA